jgi:hypothetical protein
VADCIALCTVTDTDNYCMVVNSNAVRFGVPQARDFSALTPKVARGHVSLSKSSYPRHITKR